MAALLNATVQRWFTAELLVTKPGFLGNVERMIKATAVEGYAGCANALLGLDYFRQLGRINLPALFVAGANDVAAPSAHMKNMAEQVKGARFVELSPSGHIINMQQPAKFRETLDGFIAGLPA